jgi:L-ascorbate metabolism protein UlaG (beta-lactamase superfamily)
MITTSQRVSLRFFVRNAAIVGLFTLAGCSLMDKPGFERPKSDHYDGIEFLNDPPLENRTLGAALKWIWTRKSGQWNEIRNATYGTPPPAFIGKGHLRVTYINHATLLIQVDGLNILTDPMWSERASPFSWIGPKRYRPPGIRFEDLPTIHIVLISHNHYDHMDQNTVEWLSKRDNPHFIVGLGNGHLLQGMGIKNVSELDWWERLRVSDLVSIDAVPARHDSARSPLGRSRMLWCGFVIHGSGGPIYFAGDTGMGRQFDQIQNRFGPIRLAILPIGSYLPRWFMSSVHLSPDDAVEAHHRLQAQTSVAMHFGTFDMADDAQFEATETLLQLLVQQGLENRFWILGFGEGRDVSALINAPPQHLSGQQSMHTD